MSFNARLPCSKGCLNMNWLYRYSQQAKDDQKKKYFRIGNPEDNLHKAVGRCAGFCPVLECLCDYNDIDRSSCRHFIRFEFQIQSNRSWQSESQIICAFEIEFPFSRIFGALDKTSVENKHQKLLSSSPSSSSMSTEQIQCVRLGDQLKQHIRTHKLNYDKPNAVRFHSIQKSRHKRIDSKELLMKWGGAVKCGNDSEI